MSYPQFYLQDNCIPPITFPGFPGGSDGKESAYNAGDLGSIPGPGRSPREENGYPLQYLAWKIPRTEKSGRLESTGSQRAGYDWATNHIHNYISNIY